MVHGQLVKQNDEALHRMFARMRIRHVDARESKACIAHDLPCRAQPRVVLDALRRLMDRTMHHDNAAETVAAGQQVLSLQQHRLGQVDTDTDLGWSVLQNAFQQLDGQLVASKPPLCIGNQKVNVPRFLLVMQRPCACICLQAGHRTPRLDVRLTQTNPCIGIRWLSTDPDLEGSHSRVRPTLHKRHHARCLPCPRMRRQL